MFVELAVALTLMPAIVSEEDIAIRPRLAAGDEFRLEVTRIRQDSRRPMKVTARTPVTVRVVASSADATELEWIPGNPVFDDPKVAQNPIIAASANALSGIRFRLLLDGDGAFTGLANEAEVTPKLQAAAEAILAQVLEAIPVEQRKTFEAAMRQFLSPAVLISGATTDAQIYLGLNGATLAPGEVNESSVETASPIGGGTVRASVRIRLGSATAQLASLTTTTTYDADAIRAMTAALAQQVGKPVSPETLAKMPPVEVNDRGSYSFDRERGLMQEVAVTRRAVAGVNQRMDQWVIRLVTPPKR